MLIPLRGNSIKSLVVVATLALATLLSADMFIVRPGDAQLYEKLVKESKGKRDDSLSGYCQERHGVSKLLWHETEGATPFFARIDSTHSTLSLCADHHGVELIEELDDISCFIEEGAADQTPGQLTATALHAELILDKELDTLVLKLQDEVCIRLNQESTLRCGMLRIDHGQKVAELTGSVHFTGAMGELFANRAQVIYSQVDSSYQASQVILYDEVRLIKSSIEGQGSQYALADIVYYFPQELRTVLEGITQRVLFYDEAHNVQISAHKVLAQRDPDTKQDRIQGIGDVRILFDSDELAKFKSHFS